MELYERKIHQNENMGGYQKIFPIEPSQIVEREAELFLKEVCVNANKYYK